jgi:F-type H+-transporting ATPase subunit delta
VTNKTAAIRYARALLDVAVKEKADLELIESELSQFADLFKQYPLLEKVLLNPAVPVPRKRAAVADLLAQAKFTPIVSKLLTLLADRDRLVLVPNLLQAYSDRLLDYRGVVRAEVTTAIELDPKRADAIQKGLAALTGRTVLLARKIDPSIIGGLIAQIGSTVYDGSVTRQLAKMKERLVESV